MKPLTKEEIEVKIYRSKNLPLAGKFFGVDRGGVEPLKRGDKSAPETARTRPSNPQSDATKIFLKTQKSLQKQALRASKGLVHRELITRTSIILPYNYMSRALSTSIILRTL